MSKKPWNVLFISADQWRAECLSGQGHPQVKTPHLDALAQDGQLFQQHYTVICPCGPARTSLLTGLYAMNHRSVTNGTPLDARHTNIALETRKLGYEPVLFGYTDTSLDPRGRDPKDPELSRYEGVMPGFKVGCEFHETFNREWIRGLAAKGYDVPDRAYDMFLPGDPESAARAGRGHTFAPPRYSAEDSDTAFMTDKALDYIAYHKDEPWFMHLVYLRPHWPWYAPEPYNAMYDPDQVALPQRAESSEEEGAQHPFLRTWLDQLGTKGKIDGHPVSFTALPEHETKQVRATYYGLISEVDAAIGRLVASLKDLDLYDRTLIVFTVDHGEMLGDHHLYNKGGYFDAAYHIPLIIRDPRAPSRGVETSAFTESVDLMPTLLDWLGAEVPHTLDGASLLPFLKGETPADWRSYVHWEYDFRNVVDQTYEKALGLTSDQCSLNVIRDQNYKYVHFTGLDPLFFDLQKYPGEMRNLAKDPAYQGLVLDYAQKLLSHRMLHADRSLTNTLLGPGGPQARQGPRR